MISDSYDAVVVGGGPAGLTCALRLVRNGVRTVVFEKKQEFGSPIRCGEMTGKRFAEVAGIEPRPEFIRNEYPQSTLIARDRFEMGLAETVVRSGGEVYSQAYASDFIPFDGKHAGVTVVWNKRTHTVSAPVVVACDGIESKIARRAGFDVLLRPANVGSCYGAMMEGIRIDASKPEMGVKLRLKNPHFWWIFPINESSANVGLGLLGVMGNKAQEQFGRFIEQSPVLKDGLVARVMVGVVPVSPPLENPYGDGILITGTAARMVDAQGGEGIIYALASGRFAADTILEARARRDFSKKSLARYRTLLDPMYRQLKKKYSQIYKPVFGMK